MRYSVSINNGKMSVIRLLLVILGLIVFFTPLISQEVKTVKTASKKAVKYYDNAYKEARAGNLKEASSLLEKALDEEALFIDAQVAWADVQYELGLLSKAEEGYEKAIAVDAGGATTVYFKLGETELELQKYEEAIDHLETFLKQQKRQTKSTEKASRYLKMAHFAAEATKNPVPFNPVSLGSAINTEAQEYLPSLSADGQQLIFTRRIAGQEDFFGSQKVDDQWQTAQPIDALNTQFSEGAHTLSADGQRLYFTACLYPKSLGSCDLYYTEKEKGTWTTPVNLGRTINTENWDAQPSIAADGNALFFSSDRKGGIGGRDLWVSYRTPEGDWGKPQNMGELINTPGHEETPFIHPDGQTLYFTSKGHPGMGGADLFISRKQEDGSWGAPKNLGYPINTRANEGTLAVSLDGNIGYFAKDGDNAVLNSITENQKKVSEDIFQFELYDEIKPKASTYVKAKVFDALTRRPLLAKIDFDDLTSGQERSSQQTNKDGTFLTCLPLGHNYALNVSREGYLFHSENFQLDSAGSQQEPFLLEIPLQRIPKETITSKTSPVEGKPVILKNVFFETGSAELLSTSIAELSRLKALLDQNASLRIQINGHTDAVGEAEDNQALSESRARAVYDYLITHGINADRLKYKGFGESQPIADNDTKDGRQQNRRTEFQVF